MKNSSVGNRNSLGKFAKEIGKTTQTLRDWERSGILIPFYKTKGKHRMYSEDQLNEILQLILMISNSD